MKNFKITVGLGQRSYDIDIGRGILGNMPRLLKPFLDSRKCLLISDSNVDEIYSEKILSLLMETGATPSKAVFTAGEPSKTLETMEFLYNEAVNAGLNRKSVIVALGGGVPGDMAGFAAATYMRGIDFIQIPTSLLAMVDSSVGGKTGVDLPQGKNLVGAFWQPEHVLIDPEVLTTLPERELKCGLAEVVKYAVILDEEFFVKLEQNVNALKKPDIDFYSEIIARCCELKAYVVSEDEREGGLRAILNYGHTFGHAVEAVSGYEEIAHGEAISMGMCMAADTAVKQGMLSSSCAERQKKLLLELGLTCKAPGLDPAKIFSAMGSDKKKNDSGLVFVLPEKIGKVSLKQGVPEKDVMEILEKYCE